MNPRTPLPSAAHDPRRRRFLAGGLASTALLAGGGVLAAARPGGRVPTLSGNADARRIVRAIAPVLLVGAVGDDEALPSAIDEVVRDALAGMDGLPPHARDELTQLFALLAFAPSRVVFGGLSASWESASRAAIDAMLAGWRDSRLELKRATYDALHSLIFGAWYGNPRAWARIGYGGPPSLG
jgi:hypothetical protein